VIYLLDEFPEHPKVVRAGGDAAWLYVCALAYVNRHLTGGFIPTEAVPRLSDRKAPTKLAARLVDVGLWEEVTGGYLVHDYDVHNYGAQEKRLARQEKARKAANARWTRNRQAALDLTPDAPSNAHSNAPSIGRAMPEECSPMPPTRATTTHNPQPTPLTVDRSPTSSSPTPSIDDDDTLAAFNGRMETAGRIVAADRLRRRVSEKGPVADPDAWTREAARRAFNELLAASETLGIDAAPEDLADWVLIRERAPKETLAR